MACMAPPPDWHPYRLTAVELARLGGEAALAYRGERVIERKRDQSPVTDADRAVQDLIVRALRDRHDDHAVVLEEHPEGGAAGVTADYCWIVDPIDGTRNFARGLRLFATSVALMHRGSPVAGAIFDASSGDVFSAAAGGGAFVGERPLRLADRPIGPDTTIAFSSFRGHQVPAGVRRLFDEILFRNCGSACLHQAWVAAGLIDAQYSPDTKLWDVAAGTLIVAEAGGCVTDTQGRPRWPTSGGPHEQTYDIAVGTPTAHRLLMERVQSGG